MKTQILSTNGHDERVLLELQWDGKKITVTRGKGTPLLQTLERDGIQLARKYTMKDGEAFLRNLPFAYGGSRMYAVTYDDEGNPLSSEELLHEGTA